LAGVGGYAGLDLLQAYQPQYWEAAQSEVSGLLASCSALHVMTVAMHAASDIAGLFDAYLRSHVAWLVGLSDRCCVVTVQEYARQAMLQHMQQVALYQQLAAQQLTGNDIQYAVLQQQQQGLDDEGEEAVVTLCSHGSFCWSREASGTQPQHTCS
jgi:hypothetical protein